MTTDWVETSISLLFIQKAQFFQFARFQVKIYHGHIYTITCPTLENIYLNKDLYNCEVGVWGTWISWKRKTIHVSWLTPTSEQNRIPIKDLLPKTTKWSKTNASLANNKWVK